MKVSYVLYDEKYYKYSLDYIKSLEARLEGEGKVKVYNFDEIIDRKDIFASLTAEDEIHLVGDDVIINKFINGIGINVNYKVYYNSYGIVSDFLTDNQSVQNKKEVLINNFIYDLPIVEADGKEYYFINGVSFGIDGICCNAGYEKLKKHPKMKVNFSIIALKELIFKFKPITSVITIDGVKYKYRNTYIASTLKGRYNCGTMMLAPSQDRFDDEKLVSIVTLSECDKFKALDIFSLVFKGQHIGNGKQVHIATGKEIEVNFDRKVPLLIDGINIGEVEGYKIRVN